MNYRPLGNTGLLVSEIGFGTWGLGGTSYGPVNDTDSEQALLLAYEKGVNFFDTADMYGDGHSEQIIGKTFSRIRNKIYYATKGGNLPHSGMHMPQDFSNRYLTKSLEASLKRLRTDYIDLYQLHSPTIDELLHNEKLIPLLESFKRKGMIRAFGVSVRTPEDGLIAANKLRYEVIQVNYNIIDQRAYECGLFKIAEHNIGIIIRTPLVFGFLAGKLTENELFSDKDHRANWPPEQLKRWAEAPKLFDKINKDKARTMIQLALQFCLAESAVSTVIPGMLNISHVKENISSLSADPLETKDLEVIRSIYLSNEFYDKSAKSRGKQ